MQDDESPEHSDFDPASPQGGPPAAGQSPGLPDHQHDLPALEFLGDIPLEITVELGRSELTLAEVLALGPSSIVELSKAATEPLDVRVNGVLVAHGEAVVVNERFGIRLTSVVDTDDILESIQTS